MKGQKVFCIAGMHRSGTSLLANWLHDSGVFIGDDLYGPASSNRKGHFEDMEFLELHKNDLQRKGFHPSGLQIERGDLFFEKSSLIKARRLIVKRQQHSLWGWKDPRTTIYLNQWREIIPDLKVITINRSRNQVIQSLYARLKKNKWYVTYNPLKKLWWYYQIDLNPKKWKRVFSELFDLYESSIRQFENSNSGNVLIIQFDDLIKDPDHVARQVLEFLNIEYAFIDFNTIFDKELLQNS